MITQIGIMKCSKVINENRNDYTHYWLPLLKNGKKSTDNRNVSKTIQKLINKKKLYVIMVLDFSLAWWKCKTRNQKM